MLSLLQSIRGNATGHHGFPAPYNEMAADGFVFRAGQMSMIAAAPGGCKSAFAQDIAVKAGVRTLYLSADTDPYTMAMRNAAKTLGLPQREVRDMHAGGDPRVNAALVGGLVRYSFDVQTTVDCADEVEAYATVWGDWPELIVVDNLVNVAGGDGDDYKAMRAALEQLHRMSRSTGSHVMVLHHVSGQHQTGDRPIPMTGIQFKMSEFPAQILTLYQDGGTLHVCPVKNRDGSHDVAGRFSWRLFIDLDRMLFQDHPFGAAVQYGGKTWN